MEPSPDLSSLVAEDFERRRRARVDLVDGDRRIGLAIAEVSRLGEARRAGGAFSVIFHGPAGDPLEQAIHRIDIEGLGVLELFLVPIGGDADNRHYEAVFT